jgi:CubicO group peptidase (beta-lactamase class C family)
MEDFEAKLAQATASDTKNVLGAIGIVVDDKGTVRDLIYNTPFLIRSGKILYHCASGRQSLDANAPPLDPDSVMVLGSAGKFITNIAALQLVERGVIGLDDPVYQHLPELESLLLIKHNTDDDESFTLCPPSKKITLRHLLLYASGVSNHDAPLVIEYFSSDCAKPEIQKDAHIIVKNFSIPLTFEPGEGYAYGYSIYWTQLLVTRLTENFAKYVQENVFGPPGVVSSSYRPRENPEIWDRRLRMVKRDGDKLVPTDEGSEGLACSMLDMAAIMSDLISPSPRLLNQTHIDLLFEGQFSPSSTALKDLLVDHDNYAFCVGKPRSTGRPPLNWSAAGLVAEGELPLSHMPKGTVTWEGMPNVLWAMNREKRLGMFFATQLIPVGDEIANELATTFMRDAWSKFG